MLVLVAVKTLSSMALVLAVFGLVGGCGGNSLHVGGDGGASAGRGGSGAGGGSASGEGGSGMSCHGPDEATCNATPGCVPQYCLCSGQRTYLACTTPERPPIECSPGGKSICPNPACASLDETSCRARSDCTVQQCPDCMGGQTFAGCAQPGGAGVECGPCPPTCSTFDETSCKSNDYCHPGYCADCNGGQKFTTCLGPNEAVACPKSACPVAVACANVPDEATCKGRSDCHGLYCPECNGGVQYLGCGDTGTTVACDGVCPAFKPCAAVTTSAECDARTDCHSVFVDPGTCDCAVAGCCAKFSRCLDGGKAVCKRTPLCQMATPPYCEAPTYVASYSLECYEGCVRPIECAP